jgi:hypothetical protein
VHQKDNAHENLTKHRRAWKLWIVVFGCAICTYIVIGEVIHHRHHGHIVLYGVHLDVHTKKPFVGIGGKYCWYVVDLSNYSLAPVTLRGFSVQSDDLTQEPQFRLPYRIERWDPQSSSWKLFREFLPSASPDVEPARKMLWPGFSIDANSGVILGFHDGLQNGDNVRFVVFQRDNGRAADRAFYSNSFKIAAPPDCN